MKPAERDADGKSYFEELLEEEASSRAEEVARKKKLVEYIKRQKILDEQTEKLEKDRETAARAHVDSLKRSHQSMQNATRTIEGAIANITNLLTGQLLQAVHGFSRMFIDFTQKKAAQAAQGPAPAPGEKKPDTKASGGTDGASSSSAMLAVAGPVGMVAAAMLALVGATKQLYDTMQGMARTASPAFASAWDEAITYLVTTIGVHFLPGLVEIGAKITEIADRMAESPDKVKSVLDRLSSGIGSTLGLVVSAGNPLLARGGQALGDRFSNFMGFASANRPRDESEREEERAPEADVVQRRQAGKAEATANGTLVGSGGERNQQSAMTAFLNTMQQRMTSPGGFEDVTAAFKRVQQFDANKSDLQQRTLEQQQQAVNELLQIRNNTDPRNRPPSGAAP